jgi:hypothetical protein
MRWIAVGLMLISAPAAFAGSSLSGAQFTSCFQKTCVQVKSQKAFQSSFVESSLYFAHPTIVIHQDGKQTQTWLAESVYFESASDRLLIRSLQRDSFRPVDAFYELSSGRLFLLN